MLLSLKWLREFTPYEGTAQALGDRLTMLGLELEEIITPFALDGVVVGHVLTCERHPEADKLSVCTVDAGQGETLSIVCGAPNVAQGQKVAVALVGTTLPGGLKLKKAKLRGVPSMGMICAEDELGLGDDHSGIMVLDDSLVPGTPIMDVLDLADEVLDISITPNRADCLSVLGFARETAMAFGLPLTMPEFSLQESGAPASDEMRIEIPEAEYCPVYSGRIIDGITVRRSPAAMRYRLKSIGLRPINCIVDATNYVMMELGQPMHAFDLDLLEGGVIRVARAGKEMSYTTLDDQERKLLPDDLLILDGQKPVGLAGVMGGANSEINNASTRVFLESAVFRPGSIRKTARRLALPSDASFRFERGVDHPGSIIAMNRCAAMIAELSGGQVRTGVVQNEPRPWKNATVSFRPARARKLLGIDLDDSFCATTLKGLGCEVGGETGETWDITCPSHRLDLEREADIIEEVGRVYGLDRIQATLPLVARPLDRPASIDGKYAFWMRLKKWAQGVGLNEAINYSFVGDQDLDRMGIPMEGRIPVKNPLSEEQNVLRRELVPGLMQNVRTNSERDSVRLFELSHIFIADAQSETTATEPSRLDILLYGTRYGEAWPKDSDEDYDYMDLKGLVENLLASCNLPAANYAMAEQEHAFLLPCVELRVDGELLGVLGRVRPDMAEHYDARKAVWLADLDADMIMGKSLARTIRFQDLPKFPPMRRDVTVSTPAGIGVEAILDHIRSMKLPLLEDVKLVDVFEKDDRSRNLTFRLIFRHQSKTLKDKDAEKAMKSITNSLTTSLAVTI